MRKTKRARVCIVAAAEGDRPIDLRTKQDLYDEGQARVGWRDFGGKKKRNDEAFVESQRAFRSTYVYLSRWLTGLTVPRTGYS